MSFGGSRRLVRPRNGYSRRQSMSASDDHRSSSDRSFLIAHISDLHCGSPHFQPELLDRTIEEINEMRPDVTVVSGDLTTDGFKPEYEEARHYLDRIDCEDLIVIP